MSKDPFDGKSEPSFGDVMVDSLGDTFSQSIMPIKAYQTSDSKQQAGGRQLSGEKAKDAPFNPARSAQQIAGGLMGLYQMPVELMNTGFAVLTNSVAQLVELPAMTQGGMYFGMPHTHAHPPSMTPFGPIPLPSIGPVTFGTSVQVMISGLQAARCGDIGLAPTCGGFYPAFEVKVGSSKVFIGGTRAARQSFDYSVACSKMIGQGARGAALALQLAGQAVMWTGVMADLTEAAQTDNAAVSEAMGFSAQMGALQAANDAAALAMRAMMGSDPAMPQHIPGFLVGPGISNVMIGGFPMIEFPNPADKVFGKLRRKPAPDVDAPTPQRKAQNKAANEGCAKAGDPVDAITGASFNTFDDIELPGDLPFQWKRHYNSARADQHSPIGRGFRHHYQRLLRPDIDGFCYTDEEGTETYFHAPTPESAVVEVAGWQLRMQAPGSYTLQRVGSEVVMHFIAPTPDAPAPLTRLEQEGTGLAFTYDQEGRLTRIRLNLRRYVRIEYGTHGLIEKLVLIDDRSRQWQNLASYRYDDRSCLIAWTDAAGQKATYAYKTAGRLTRYGNRRGYDFFFEYDDDGRCIHTHGQDGLFDVRLEYFPKERYTRTIDADGAERQYYYDESGTIIQIIDPCGGAWGRRVEDGRLIEEIDPNGQAIRVLYSDEGAALGKVDATGRRLTMDREPIDGTPEPGDQLTASPLGWDHGDLLSPAPFRRLGSTDPVLRALPTGAIDAVGLDPTPEPVEKNHDLAGRPLQAPDLAGRLLQHRYDPLGQILERSDGAGAFHRWTYDAEGNITAYRDPGGAEHRYTYDSWNLLTAEHDPLGHTTRYAYSPRCKVTSITDAGGTESRYEYDLKDRLVAVYRGNNLVEQYRYDAADNLIEKRDAEGKALLEIEVGDGNLPVEQRLASGEVHRFTYDDQGRITEMKSDVGTVERAYEDDRRILETQDGLGVEHWYEGARFVETAYFDAFVVTVDYEEDGTRILRDPTGRTHRIRASAAGLVARTLAGGTTEVARYDAGGRCLRKAVFSRGSTWTRDYRYSPAGDLLTVADSVRGERRYTYDRAHRLTGAFGLDGTSARYAYDRAGNLMEMPELRDVYLGPMNRLATANGDRFTYDARGRITHREGPLGATDYTYDARGLLVGVRRKRWDGTEMLDWKAGYDPLGRRLWKRWGTHEIRYWWDGDRLAAEQDETGRVRLYCYADPAALVPFLFVDYDNLEAEPETGRVYHVFTDQIGTPIRVESAESVVWQAEITPYGTAIVLEGDDFHQPLRFPGHYYDDETGLHYNRYRTYSPELGRYLQSDPLGTAGGVNLYAYTPNPLVAVDLMGLQTCNMTGDKATPRKDSPDAEQVRQPEAKKPDPADKKPYIELGEEKHPGYIPGYLVGDRFTRRPGNKKGSWKPPSHQVDEQGQPLYPNHCKLHVSTDPATARTTMDDVLPVLRDMGVDHKIAQDPATLSHMQGNNQQGKFITIYCKDPAHADQVAAAIEQRLRPRMANGELQHGGTAMKRESVSLEAWDEHGNPVKSKDAFDNDKKGLDADMWADKEDMVGDTGYVTSPDYQAAKAKMQEAGGAESPAQPTSARSSTGSNTASGEIDANSPKPSDTQKPGQGDSVIVEDDAYAGTKPEGVKSSEYGDTASGEIDSDGTIPVEKNSSQSDTASGEIHSDAELSKPMRVKDSSQSDTASGEITPSDNKKRSSTGQAEDRPARPRRSQQPEGSKATIKTKTHSTESGESSVKQHRFGKATKTGKEKKSFIKRAGNFFRGLFGKELTVIGADSKRQSDQILTVTRHELRAMLLQRKHDLKAWDDLAQDEFKQWFGSTDDHYKQIVETRIDNMIAHLDEVQFQRGRPEHVTLGEDMDWNDVHGYASPHADEMVVYIGPQFIERDGYVNNPFPNDTKAGGVGHEMTHFDKLSDSELVGGTQDYAYGKDDCQELAGYAPLKAVDNADSYGFFLEGAKPGRPIMKRVSQPETPSATPPKKPAAQSEGPQRVQPHPAPRRQTQKLEAVDAPPRRKTQKLAAVDAPAEPAGGGGTVGTKKAAKPHRFGLATPAGQRRAGNSQRQGSSGASTQRAATRAHRHGSIDGPAAEAAPPPSPQNRPRPLFGQYDTHSCLIASTRMIIATLKDRDVLEARLRLQSYQTPSGGFKRKRGTEFDVGESLLQRHEVDGAQMHTNQSIDDLQRATDNGHPAIVGISTQEGGHAIVVDEVRTNPDGTRTVIGRDPWPPGEGRRFETPESEFAGSYDRIMISTDPEYTPNAVPDFDDEVTGVHQLPDFNDEITQVRERPPLFEPDIADEWTHVGPPPGPAPEIDTEPTYFGPPPTND